MQIYRYHNSESISTDLDPMDDAMDWLAGLQSVTRIRQILIDTRKISVDEAKRRAKRASYFAGIAIDFIEAAQHGRPHVAFLPIYYAYLNICKLVIACSDFSDEVEGGITHGVSYDVGQKNSQSLFTENLRLWGRGVFPVLYRVLTGRRIPIRKKARFRSIALRNVYSRLISVAAEFSIAAGTGASQLAVAQWLGVSAVPAGAGFVLKAKMMTSDDRAVDAHESLPALPQWKPAAGSPYEWVSPVQSVAKTEDFDWESAVDRRFLYLPTAGLREVSAFALAEGRLVFAEELPIFLALYHLSSVVRYKPRFLDTVRDSNAWPLALAARRHLLYRGTILGLSNVMQRTLEINRD